MDKEAGNELEELKVVMSFFMNANENLLIIDDEKNSK
jgi:hypothetical protein